LEREFEGAVKGDIYSLGVIAQELFDFIINRYRYYSKI
jgi:hypothetical protein